MYRMKSRISISLLMALSILIFCLCPLSDNVSADKDAAVTSFPDNTLRSATNWFVTELSMLVETISDTILDYPDPEDVKTMVQGFIRILIPVYIIAIIIIGIYILFTSISPEGRARAKSMLLKLILSMIVVSMSMELYSLLVSISKGIAYSVSGGIYLETSLLPKDVKIELIFLLLFVLLITITTYIVVFFIKIFILLFAALFPFTLFFYLFDLTKAIGTTLFRYTLMAIFSPVVMALMLSIAAKSLGMFYYLSGWEQFTVFFIVGAGFLMIAMAPLMMLGILKWIGGAIAGLGVYMAMTQPRLPLIGRRGGGLVGGALTAAGGIGAGMGPGALLAAGASYSFGSAARRTTVTDREKNRDRS